jgi:hypothetical protein
VGEMTLEAQARSLGNVDTSKFHFPQPFVKSIVSRNDSLTWGLSQFHPPLSVNIPSVSAAKSALFAT